jgi:hypothetical protein
MLGGRLLPFSAAVPPRRSAVRVQSSVEHSDHIIKTVTAADRFESLAAANSAGAS